MVATTGAGDVASRLGQTVPLPTLGAQWLHGDCGQTERQAERQTEIYAIADITHPALDRAFDAGLVAWLTQLQAKAALVSPIWSEAIAPNDDEDEPRLWGLLIGLHGQGIRKWNTIEQSITKHIATHLGFAIYSLEMQQALAKCQCQESQWRAALEGAAERISMEVQLRQSQAIQAAIIQAIPDLLIRMRSDGTYLECLSDADFNTLDPHQLRGRTATHADILPPDLAQMQMRYIQRAVTSGLPQVYEHTVLVHGEPHHEEIRITPLPHDEVLVMVRDISVRKQAEETLRQQKEMLQTILDHIPLMITICDKQGHVKFVNPAWEKILGWPLADCQQQEIMEKCYPDPVYRQQVWENILAFPEHWKDCTTQTAWGMTVETSWVDLPLQDGLILSIGQNISDRIRKEKMLQEAMTAIESANRAKSLFLANMSHELRTPLNVILGFAQLLRRDTDLTDAQQNALQTIHRSGKHLLSLINDVLDFSKIEAGRCSLENNVVDLLALLHTLHQMVDKQAQAKGITLEMDIDPELPRAIIADGPKLRQILLNFLSNAIKFTHQGQVRLVATVVGGDPLTSPAPLASPSSSPEASAPLPVTPQFQMLQFQVIDTGVGMAAEELDSIFQTFLQGQAGKAAMQGSGLGLSICKNLVDLMGGQLSVSSELGVGSTFSFTMTAALTDDVGSQAEPLDQMVIAVTPEHRQRRILVVDDQPENRLLLVTLLQRVGLAVREASNGHEAIQQWQAWQPDAILMDIRMPEIDGYEATRQIRALEGDTSHVFILAVTAHSSQSDRALTLAAGCDDFIMKPFQETTLFHQLNQYLGLEYIYADLDTSASPPSSASRCPPADCIPAFLESLDLGRLSPFWSQKLDDAAICGDDLAIRDLVKELPPHLVPLATYLNTLGDRYQFEQILHLLPLLTPIEAQP